MYNISSRIFKIPKEIVKIRHAPHVGEVTKVVTPIVTKFINFHSNKSHYNSERFRKYSYKYLLYSILFGATTYTSYKIW